MRRSTRANKKSQKKSKSRGRKASDFAYLMQRKCLRMMRRYYKDKFENFGLFENYQSEMRSITIEDFERRLWTFMENEFSYALEYEAFCKFINLLETLKTLILSDRYNKNEPIIEGLDFEVVRQTLYNFNTRNLLNFFSTKGFSFLFFHYFERWGRRDAENQTDIEPDIFFKEMQELYNESEKYLKIAMDNFSKFENQHIEYSPVCANEEEYINSLKF